MTAPNAPLADPWEVVASGLRSMIIDGDLAPGERIIENTVATRFGVSRGPVREAIRALEVTGLVVRIPRRGSFVAPIEPKDVYEVYALRECIEVHAVEQAILASPVVATRVTEAVGRMRVLADDAPPSVLIDEDLAFHSEFYLAANNARLTAVWNGLRDPLRVMILLTSHRSRTDWEGATSGHDAIARAAADGDVARAVEKTRQHLALARDRIAEYLRDRETLGP